MNSQHDKPKRWQFKPSILIVAASILLVLGWAVSGTFGAATQLATIELLGPFIYPLGYVMFLALIVIVPCVLMAYVLRLLHIK